MIVPRYYEDLAVLHENTLPARSYYIPSSTPLDPGPEARDSSDRLQLLNGEWSFRYFESIHELRDHFYERDFPAGGFDTPWATTMALPTASMPSISATSAR